MNFNFVYRYDVAVLGAGYHAGTIAGRLQTAGWSTIRVAVPNEMSSCDVPAVTVDAIQHRDRHYCLHLPNGWELHVRSLLAVTQNGDAFLAPLTTAPDDSYKS